jgi:hypothetical protein
MALPWSSSIDVSYVGQRAFNRQASRVNINAVDFGAAYLPENQDPTRTPSATPGATALTTNLLRPFRGFGNIQEHRTIFYEEYHSIQTSFNRRFSGGLSFGANYTWSISHVGNNGLQLRLQHAPDGTISVRDDQAAYEELNKTMGALRPHVFKGNMVWDLPDVNGDTGAMRAVAALANDWQLSGILTAGSGNSYDIGYSYQNNGSSVNLTGSPSYNARIVYLGDPGSGCASDQYRQFNTASVTGPSYGSVGLESGRSQLRGCADRRIDLSLSRNIRLGGGRNVQLRVDAFNAFNIVNYTNREDEVEFVSPTNLTVRNSQTLADGSLDPDRLTPRTAGFGAVTNAASMRTIRLTARFSF